VGTYFAGSNDHRFVEDGAVSGAFLILVVVGVVLALGLLLFAFVLVRRRSGCICR
jgi:hypothetical protein